MCRFQYKLEPYGDPILSCTKPFHKDSNRYQTLDVPYEDLCCFRYNFRHMSLITTIRSAFPLCVFSLVVVPPHPADTARLARYPRLAVLLLTPLCVNRWMLWLLTPLLFFIIEYILFILGVLPINLSIEPLVSLS